MLRELGGEPLATKQSKLSVYIQPALVACPGSRIVLGTDADKPRGLRVVKPGVDALYGLGGLVGHRTYLDRTVAVGGGLTNASQVVGTSPSLGD